MKKVLAMLFTISILLCSCTAQQRAKKYGGSAVVNLPANTTLVTATWKGDNLWLLYRNRKNGEQPTSYQFRESSSWGMFEGVITIKEK